MLQCRKSLQLQRCAPGQERNHEQSLPTYDERSGLKSSASEARKRKSPFLAEEALSLTSDRDYGRAIVMTDEVQVSQCAGLLSSPRALSTDTFTTYWPFGTVCH